MQQGRQECRPSDGPATLLSPMVGMEICFFPSGPKLVLVGRLPCSTGDKSVAHPTDRRHSCRRWWAWKSVSSRRCQNLFWWVRSQEASRRDQQPLRGRSFRLLTAHENLDTHHLPGLLPPLFMTHNRHSISAIKCHAAVVVAAVAIIVVVVTDAPRGF